MKKVTKAVIPAAGLGTRVLPATKALPKEMLTIVDKPSLQYIVEELVASGITDIVIITGRNKNSIEDHFDFSYELENTLKNEHKSELLDKVSHISTMANIYYVRQNMPLGLGHAILKTKSFIGDEPFVIALGDDIIPSLSVQKLKYKCKVPLIQNFTLLFYLFFLLCTNLYHNNLILLILLFLFSILFLVIYLTLSFLHFLVIYNIHLLSWLLLRYS